MRKYDESMPTPTSYRHIDLKITVVLLFFILPILWCFAIRGLWVESEPLKKVSARVMKVGSDANGYYLDVSILDSAKKSLLTLTVRPEDCEKFSVDQVVDIVRGSSETRRYDYMLFEYAKADQFIYRTQLWIGVLFPPVIALYVYFRRRRPAPQSPFRAESI